MKLNAPMKLNYRGTAYTPSAQGVETVPTGIQLFFLGRCFSLRQPKSAPATHRTQTLRYRGVSYQAQVANAINA